MKKGKWIIVAAILVVVIGGAGFLWTKASNQTASINYVSHASHTVIHPTGLVNSIATTGTVESVTKKNVYTTLGFTIKEVNVELGDEVTEGQVLCALDPEDLELTIAQQKADLDALQRSNLLQLQSNKRLYNEAAANLTGGANSQVVGAESALKTASINLENAQKNYDDALKEYQDGTNQGLTTAESNLLSAELDLDAKKTTFENNKLLYEAGAISKEAYTQSENTYVTAQNKYNDALTNLESAKTTQKKALEQSENALKAAQTAYDNATATQSATQIGARQDLEKYQSNIENSQIAINNDSKLIAIQKLENQLADSVIKAPISGVVTAVYAKEGATGAGLLFVIEDTKHLKITTTINEYDVANVKPGMKVTIKSDSIGNAVYEGVISRVAPAAVKAANGETVSTAEGEFETNVDIVSPQTDLKIGMKARLNVILEEKENIYCVPREAVTKNRNGESIVFIAADNGQKPEQIVVTTGMETDFDVEITSDALADGMKVINDASAFRDEL